MLPNENPEEYGLKVKMDGCVAKLMPFLE